MMQSSGASMDPLVPENATPHQQAIIQAVAQSVAQSCDPSQFQALLMERTKHNHNFLFLIPTHPLNSYYQYLLMAYTETVRQFRQTQIQAMYAQYYAAMQTQQMQAQQPQAASAVQVGFRPPSVYPVEGNEIGTFADSGNDVVQQPKYALGVAIGEARPETHSEMHHALRKRQRTPPRSPEYNRQNVPQFVQPDVQQPQWKIIVENGIQRAVRM